MLLIRPHGTTHAPGAHAKLWLSVRLMAKGIETICMNYTALMLLYDCGEQAGQGVTYAIRSVQVCNARHRLAAPSKHTHCSPATAHTFIGSQLLLSIGQSMTSQGCAIANVHLVPMTTQLPSTTACDEV